MFPAITNAGTTMQNLNSSTTMIKLRNDIDAKRIYDAIVQGKIAEQKQRAKAQADEVLSAEELALIKQQADEVLRKARLFVEALRAQDGAMVFCSSEVIK